MKKRLEGITGRLTRVLTSVKFIVIFAAVVLVGTFIAWQYHSTTDPDRLFWGMVDNSLQTGNFTRHNYQKSGGQSVDQIIRVQSAPEQIVNSETVFEQTGVDSARAITENVGTPTTDYVRYTSIKTAQKSISGGELDFSKVLNVWGITEPETPGQTVGQLFNQSVLGVIPTGSITASERRQLIELMQDKNAYTYKITETKRSWPFARPTYKFEVTISPVGYISALKQFAEFEGLNHLDRIDPNEYEGAQKLVFTVSVDGWTRQIVEIQQSQGAKNEVITGRNLKVELDEAPKDTISVDELQMRLQSVQ